MLLANKIQVKIRHYDTGNHIDNSFSVNVKDIHNIVLNIEGDIELILDESSFNELRNKLNEAYELRQM
ncbi:hypothetical protein GNF80_06435 [Clostridium perfringens]|nr:hypothetical protein [Clostridium perfringens]